MTFGNILTMPIFEINSRESISPREAADWLLGLERDGGGAGPADGVGPRVGRARLDGLKAAIRSLLDQY